MDTATRKGVFSHELGHVFGLGHVTDPYAVMCTSADGRIVTSPQDDDIDGVNSLY
ncbi:matrixin family metalloprotease [Paenibacillus sp. PL91]|uniref:matrixin family metalloprotease n=1 Tax=Paenibacillus sp. PL91 TaxID=2729538 RepID=UPI00145D4692|nr:matrixin family metalloprotease [Paenibacillus sp. PL91]